MAKRTMRCGATRRTQGLVAKVAADRERAGVLAGVLRALGNPARLRILAYLLGCGERTVTDISASLGLAQAVTSQQLSALRLNGLLQVRRDGGSRRYSVALPVVGDLLGCLARCYEEHGGRLARGES
ncbi:MAG: helix-turn-helix transcriptional regulator [Deltaproteobacteria bacterium]|nr:helix-turn-helix transcriptional regulator [Deltaproteobacteria bacterium]